MRKVRSDKKVKVLAGLTQDDHDKLQKLAISCGMTKTKLAEHIISLCLNSEDHVNWYQDKFNKDDKYRIVVHKTPEGIEYI
ncbi:MAG: hypothetical protein ACQEWV_30520 [Bacillota bacterium]